MEQHVDPMVAIQEAVEASEMAEVSRRTRKRPLVLYFGRSYFGDNSKYVFLSDLARGAGYEIYWCTLQRGVAAELKSLGVPVVHLSDDVRLTIDLLTQAAVTVFTVNPKESLGGNRFLQACLAGSKKIQLWHGVSVKHLLLELAPYLGYVGPEWRRNLVAGTDCDYVLSSAARFDRFWSRVFGCDRIVRANQARNVVLTRAASPMEMVGSRLEARSQSALEGSVPNVLLAPTWQRNGAAYTMSSEFLRQSANFAETHGVNMFFKGHPMMWDLFGKSGGSGRFHFIKAEVDLYPHLQKFDALVTDYSSIMFDFLYVDKPILTLRLEKGEHQAYEPDWSLVPDVPFRDPFDSGTYPEVLEQALTGLDGRATARQEMRDLVFESSPEQAAPQVLKLVDGLVQQVVDPPLNII